MVEPVVSKVEDPEVIVATTSEVVTAVAKRVVDPVVDPSLFVRAEVVIGRRPSEATAEEALDSAEEAAEEALDSAEETAEEALDSAEETAEVALPPAPATIPEASL